MTVYGPGFGEAMVVHLGAGDWMTVDSCLDGRSGRPWALQYLSDLGVDVAEQVKVVVVTHYDDDHVRGVAELACQATSASIVCSAALCRRDVLQFVIEQERAATGIGSGLDELRSLLQFAAQRGEGIIWAKANLPVHPRPPGDSPAVIALSPSENAVERSVEALVLAAAGTGASPAVARRFRAPDGPNMSSVVTRVISNGTELLLGADLERSSNPETGWDAVLRYAKPSRRSAVVKVPHHASEGAHHDDVWVEMLEDDPIAVITPWVNAGNYLPLERDLDRLKGLTTQVYLTAVPAFRRAKLDRDVERLVKRLHGGSVEELVGDGAVRLRKRPAEDTWRVELQGDARVV